MHVRYLFLIALRVFQAILLVFMRKVVAQNKICNTHKAVSLLYPRKKEYHVVGNRIRLRKGFTKQKSAKKTKQASGNSNFSGKGYLIKASHVKTPLHENREVVR